MIPEPSRQDRDIVLCTNRADYLALISFYPALASLKQYTLEDHRAIEGMRCRTIFVSNALHHGVVMGHLREHELLTLARNGQLHLEDPKLVIL